MAFLFYFIDNNLQESLFSHIIKNNFVEHLRKQISLKYHIIKF